MVYQCYSDWVWGFSFSSLFLNSFLAWQLFWVCDFQPWCPRMLRGSCKRQPGRADVSVLQGFSSVPRDCTSTGMYPGTNSLESRWKIIVTKFYLVFLGAAIQAFSWSLGWWFSLHQRYSLALVVVFVCKSDLKVVLRRAKSRNKRYESCFTQRKV